jgi:hypothetical protein
MTTNKQLLSWILMLCLGLAACQPPTEMLQPTKRVSNVNDKQSIRTGPPRQYLESDRPEFDAGQVTPFIQIILDQLQASGMEANQEDFLAKGGGGITLSVKTVNKKNTLEKEDVNLIIMDWESQLGIAYITPLDDQSFVPNPYLPSPWGDFNVSSGNVSTVEGVSLNAVRQISKDILKLNPQTALTQGEISLIALLTTGVKSQYAPDLYSKILSVIDDQYSPENPKDFPKNLGYRIGENGSLLKGIYFDESSATNFNQEFALAILMLQQRDSTLNKDFEELATKRSSYLQAALEPDVYGISTETSQFLVTYYRAERLLKWNFAVKVHPLGGPLTTAYLSNGFTTGDIDTLLGYQRDLKGNIILNEDGSPSHYPNSYISTYFLLGGLPPDLYSSRDHKFLVSIFLEIMEDMSITDEEAIQTYLNIRKEILQANGQ